MTITAVPFPDVDDLTVEFCIDGYIAFRKLTRREREAVVARCLARGWTQPEIVTKCHATTSTVATAVQELRAHEGVIAHDDVA